MTSEEKLRDTIASQCRTIKGLLNRRPTPPTVEPDLHGLKFEEVVARYPEQAAKHMMDMAQKVAKLERLAKTAKGECMKVAWEMSMVAKQHLKVLGPLFWISDINKWSQQIRLANLTDCPDCVIDVEKEAQLLSQEEVVPQYKCYACGSTKIICDDCHNAYEGGRKQ